MMPYDDSELQDKIRNTSSIDIVILLSNPNIKSSIIVINIDMHLIVESRSLTMFISA